MIGYKFLKQGEKFVTIGGRLVITNDPENCWCCKEPPPPPDPPCCAVCWYPISNENPDCSACPEGFHCEDMPTGKGCFKYVPVPCMPNGGLSPEAEEVAANCAYNFELQTKPCKIRTEGWVCRPDGSCEKKEFWTDGGGIPAGAYESRDECLASCNAPPPSCEECTLAAARVNIMVPAPGPNTCHQYRGEVTFPLIEQPGGGWTSPIGVSFPDHPEGSTVQLVVDQCNPATRKWRVKLDMTLGCTTPEGFYTGTLEYSHTTYLECGQSWSNNFDSGGFGTIALLRQPVREADTANPLP